MRIPFGLLLHRLLSYLKDSIAKFKNASSGCVSAERRLERHPKCQMECFDVTLPGLLCGFDVYGWGIRIGKSICRRRKHSVSLTDFGGVGDGITSDTKALKAAIDYLSEFGTDGSGLLIVPP